MDNNFQINISAVITRGTQVLLTQRSEAEDVFPGLWGIPGGKMDSTDNDLLSALKREIREEVGIEVEGFRVLKDNVVNKPDKNVLYITVATEYVSGTPTALEEVQNVGWFNVEQIPAPELFTPFTRDLVLSVLDK